MKTTKMPELAKIQHAHITKWKVLGAANFRLFPLFSAVKAKTYVLTCTNVYTMACLQFQSVHVCTYKG